MNLSQKKINRVLTELPEKTRFRGNSTQIPTFQVEQLHTFDILGVRHKNGRPSEALAKDGSGGRIRTYNLILTEILLLPKGLDYLMSDVISDSGI